MGVDVCAVAAWGLRATYVEIRKTFVRSRTWIGPALMDRSFEFDPKTGKPNYETYTAEPEELKRWRFRVLDKSGSGSKVYYAGEKDTDECIVVFAETCTRTHRDGIFIEKIPEEPPGGGRLSAFQTDMSRIGLWRGDHFGLWLFLDIG